MQGGVVELARQAAAAARAERGARGAARLPVRRYRGVTRRGDVYVAEIMDAAGLRPVCLGLYATPEEAAYAYDAAARIMHGNKAKPNFPEPPAPAPAAWGGGGVAHAVVLRPLVGHAPLRAPLNGHQAPMGRGAQRQAFFVQQAPPAPYFRAPPVPYHGVAAPAFSQFLYRSAAGPAFAAAGGSNGAGFYAAGPALAAAGGSNGAGFYAAGPALAAAGGSNGGAGGFYAAGPAPAAADGSNGGAGGFYGMASMIGPEPEVLIPTYAASSALSSSDKKNKAVVGTDLKLVTIIESDGEPVVEDNFTPGDGGASTSSAACPAVPPLRLKDLMESEVVRRSADEGAP